MMRDYSNVYGVKMNYVDAHFPIINPKVHNVIQMSRHNKVNAVQLSQTK